MCAGGLLLTVSVYTGLFKRSMLFNKSTTHRSSGIGALRACLLVCVCSCVFFQVRGSVNGLLLLDCAPQCQANKQLIRPVHCALAWIVRRLPAAIFHE